MKRNKFILLVFVLVFVSGFLGWEKYVQAQNESDAIAVRIFSNPEHYGINEWYEKQGFTGSPQALIIDGYEAIRDGRTVYVNAINSSNKNLYTNIYLISYNQSSSDKTVDILGQIIKKWKFNTNMEEVGTCSISLNSCSSGETDCPVDQQCVLDSDCSNNFFCDSLKAKAIRDLKRAAMVTNLNSSLNIYKTLNGFYPKLESGTYVPHISVSVWPSWNDKFLPTLNLKNLKDPINRLGDCPGFDPVTCWNKDTNKFSTNVDLINKLELPAGSYGFVYKTDSEGSSYQLCSVLETRESGYSFVPEIAAISDCVKNIGASSEGGIINTAPQIVDLYLVGEPGKEFNGSVKAIDAENNPLTWSLETDFDWRGDGWSAAPVLLDTNMPNVKKIYAARAGSPGERNIRLTVEDGQGGVASTTTKITIISPKPFIEAEDAVFDLNTGDNEVLYSFYLSDSTYTAANIINFFSIEEIGSDNVFNFASITPVISLAGENRYKIVYQIPLSSNISFSSDVINSFKITARNNYNAEVVTKDIKITLKKPTSPEINFNCPESARISNPYSCLLGPINKNNQTLSYSQIDGLPSGLSILASSSQVYLSGSPTALYTGQVNIKVTGAYSAFSTISFPLKVNNYCGDGIKQWPNTEGRGGVHNYGYESCDGEDGIAPSVASSSLLMQYGCTNGLNNPAPYPILADNKYCVFKSPIEGGGYCGDGYCQRKINGKMMENKCNCPVDCVGSCCGDGVCDEGIENNQNCPADCHCGDGVCNYGENYTTCPADCLCGNGEINSGEACDPGIVYQVEAALEGNPSHCPATATTTIICKNDCTGFEESPTIASETNTFAPANMEGGNFSAITQEEYICCELVSCYKAKDCDKADEAPSTIEGYGSYLYGLQPFCGSNLTTPVKGTSCKIFQNIANKKQWGVAVNKAAAEYRCWYWK
ncbi:hypothetical protein GX917_00130 [Candidatus Falkowbacteria bacterium]|jgi:hypothetical protein|nr:hypothetical protein [Candidatus Falkowbacteria bacterium]